MISLQRVGKLLLICLLSLGSEIALASPESGSLQWSPDRQTLFSANFDAGSVSRIPRTNPAAVEELVLGRDIRRLALSDDGALLLASDYLGDQLLLIDAKTLTLKRRIDTPYRPFGVVFDPQGQRFWATAFEGHRLLAIDRNGELLLDLPTVETPRGLALTDDGRLLVSHAMTGQVSIYDVREEQPALIKLIDLAIEQHADEFVSQGLPRLLDDIAISPDGAEAWLPHLLWNFDHPFQFQSTVFPAISVLSLEPGAEAEKPALRQQLFQQINVLDRDERPQVISNPHDAGFSDDGKRLYVTLAASEDLLVVDLSKRQAPVASQLLRHLPGDNPRGLAIDGRDIFVQNAMSHELVRVDRGNTAHEVSVADANFARTIRKDPLTPNRRLGARLFHSGNNDDFPNFPPTGNFRMSCASCHLDGFNFTNRYLMQAHGESEYNDAISGHAGLKTLIASDFTGDYLRIFQQTQGGMGQDSSDGAVTVDPDQPDKALRDLMFALHSFIRAEHNLPYLSTWLRVEGESGTPRIHAREWLNSAECRSCHSEIFDQWADSNHRLAAESNPYYQVMEDLAGATEGEAFRAWCSGCHNPQRTSVGLPFRGKAGHMFERGADSLLDALNDDRVDLDEGTGCLFCHRVTRLEDAGGNAAMTVNLRNRERYVFEHAGNPLLDWLGDRQINARPAVHAASYSQDFYRDARYCQSCHDEFAPGSGADIVDTYGEWEASSFNAPDDPGRHRSCIDCHMHADTQRIGEQIPGISTDGGRVKENVVTHQFTGANHHLVGLRNPDQERMSIELLKTAAELSQRIEDDELVVRVRNVGAGHALPTGVADFRQFWLQITVRDAHGEVVLDHGRPDAEGHLPADARPFMKVLGDAEGKPVGLRFWRYEKLLSDRRIPADGYRDERFALPADVPRPLQLDTRLLYRIYPQWVTDLVKQRVPELPDPPVLELNRLSTVIH